MVWHGGSPQIFLSLSAIDGKRTKRLGFGFKKDKENSWTCQRRRRSRIGREERAPEIWMRKVRIKLRARLVDCNDDYIRIGIDITRNKRCCNVIIIHIQLFGNPIVIEPRICIPHVWYNILKRCNENF